MAAPEETTTSVTTGEEAPAVEGLEQRLEALEAERDEYLDDLRRLAAEFDNYRKRTLKEQTRILEGAAEGLIRRLLEVLDDFQLAMAAADAKPEFERFVRGFQLVYAKLLDALKAEGLEPIEAHGAPFDPGLHEALMSEDDSEGDLHVSDVLRPGYAVRGRVIRPAGVKVGRRPASE